MTRTDKGAVTEGGRRIAAKRQTVSIKTLKERHDRGEDISGARALIRLGTAGTEILVGGAVDLSEWDNDELRHGQRRNKNGVFVGRAPKVIPKALYDELVKRTMSEAQQLFVTNLVKAVEVLTELATDSSVEPKDRLRAVAMIMDRAMGKTPDTVRVVGEAKWETALTAGIVSITHERSDDEDDSDIMDLDPEGDE